MKPILYILILFLMYSCYDDEGNYDYRDINTVSVSLDEVYAYRLDKETTVTISPQLTQSLQQNKENLRYVWLYSTVNHNFYGRDEFDTVSVEEKLSFHIDPNEKNLKYEHYFRLNVYDETTGIEYPANTTIQLIKPYDGAWMVLHSKNGQTQLGAVEYQGGEMTMNPDAYYQETGKRFQGRPLCLGRYTTSCKYYGTGSSWNMFSVITDIPTEAGVYCQWKKFEKKDSLSRMVAPLAQNGFDFQGVTQMDGDGRYSAILLANGVFYQTPRAGKIYKPGTEWEGDMEIHHATKMGGVALLYDEAGHRFGFYDNNSDGLGTKKYDPLYFTESEENADLIQSIPIRDGNSSAADPNHVDPGQEMLYVGSGYNFDPSSWNSVYGYALAQKGNECFVYEFNTRGMTNSDYPSFSGYYVINLPKGLDKNSCFASSAAFSGIIFYTSGNTVYRLDFRQTGGKATAVYTHPGGKATRMGFARKSLIDQGNYERYEFDLNRSLGVAFERGDGSSDFVILNLSSTGGIGSDSEHYPAQQIYQGFGEIRDFVFI